MMHSRHLREAARERPHVRGRCVYEDYIGCIVIIVIVVIVIVITPWCACVVAMRGRT
jgi:hypothetical protein